jgi:hypothetical protein
MSNTSVPPPRAANDSIVSNTDIVLVVLHDLGGDDRRVHIEDVAETAWKHVPARFSWPKLQKYPDLDAVDVTLRATKKNDGLVTGSKREGWMLTPAGIHRVGEREPAVREFITRQGGVGRTENRRERGGLDSSAVRRLAQLRESSAAMKFAGGDRGGITVYDFLAFFNINQYMPLQKYRTNRQAVENLVRTDAELLAVTLYLNDRFGETYKTDLEKGLTHGNT